MKESTKIPKLVIKPEFDAKLKKLRIKTKFIKYCKTINLDNEIPPKTELRRRQNNAVRWCDFINYAFLWSATPEGAVYWSEISEQQINDKLALT